MSQRSKLARKTKRLLAKYDKKKKKPKRKLKKVKRKPKRKRTMKQIYSAYMRSKRWEKRRNLYWETHDKECALCGETRRVQLHHMYYDEKLFGVEPDKHFMPLCVDCHKLFHDTYPTQKDMIADTLQFIEEHT